MNARKLAELEDIHKVFETPDMSSGAARKLTALDGVSMVFYPAEIHAILGENGAGKSTLAHILSGLHRPSRGAIRLGGETLRFDSTEDALTNGIAMVHQRPLLADDITVLENVILGSPAFLLRRKEALRKFASIAEKWRIALDPASRAGLLSPADRFRAALIGALWRNPDYLILDEPSGVLSPEERDALFSALSTARDEGLGIILITHRLEEASRRADRVSVLRRGKLVWSSPTRDRDNGSPVTESTLMSILDPESASSGEIKIEGGDSRAHIAQTSPSSQGNHTESALSLAHITSSKKNRPSLFDVSLEVFPGRITAIAGYPGSGLDALEDILSGMITADGGDIRIGSKKIPLARVSPALLRRKGVAAVPSDRAFRGSNPDITVRELLCAYRSAPFLLRNREDGDFVREVISREGIDVESARLVRTLSGGQLQRLILARELSTDPAVIVLSSPEWGLDIKSAELLRKRLMDIAMRGTAVLILSEETGSGGLFASDHILKDGRLS